MDVVPPVVASDEARQHAAVGRVRFAGDYGEPDARFGPHPEALEHLHVGMAAAQ